MRTQIMLALEHQDAILNARSPAPPVSSRASGDSGRARADGRALQQQLGNGYRPEPGALGGPRKGAGGGGQKSARGVHDGDEMGVGVQEDRLPRAIKLPKDLSLKPVRGQSRVPPAMFQRNRTPPPAHREPSGPPYGRYHTHHQVTPRAAAHDAAVLGGKGAGRAPRVDRGAEEVFESLDARVGARGGGDADDVKVSFRVLSEREAAGNKAAARGQGRAAAIAAQEREQRNKKQQEVVKNLVRNQVLLENRYPPDAHAERYAKLQRINHGGAMPRRQHNGLWPSR
jgi:hypothetical protein